MYNLANVEDMDQFWDQLICVRVHSGFILELVNYSSTQNWLICIYWMALRRFPDSVPYPGFCAYLFRIYTFPFSPSCTLFRTHSAPIPAPSLPPLPTFARVHPLVHRIPEHLRRPHKSRARVHLRHYHILEAPLIHRLLVMELLLWWDKQRVGHRMVEGVGEGGGRSGRGGDDGSGGGGGRVMMPGGMMRMG